jgi:hypothetical protein
MNGGDTSTNIFPLPWPMELQSHQNSNTSYQFEKQLIVLNDMSTQA